MPRGRGPDSEERAQRVFAEGEYPWEQHELAVHHLDRLELEEARTLIVEMLPRLKQLPPERAGVAGLLAFSLLGRMRSATRNGTNNGEDRSSVWSQARAFADVQDGAQLAAMLARAAEEDLRVTPRPGPGNPLVERARNYIEQNYSRKLSLRDVAAHLNISRNYLSGLFRKECGCTITEYIHRTRLRRAEALLLAGGRTVSEIAYQVGYQNYRDFYRNFVKHTRSSPTRYRRRHEDRRTAPQETPGA